MTANINGVKVPVSFLMNSTPRKHYCLVKFLYTALFFSFLDFESPDKEHDAAHQDKRTAMTSKVLFFPLFPQTVSTLTNIPSCDPACRRGYRQCNGSRDEKWTVKQKCDISPTMHCIALHCRCVGT